MPERRSGTSVGQHRLTSEVCYVDAFNKWILSSKWTQNKAALILLLTAAVDYGAGLALCKGKRVYKCSLWISILGNWAHHSIALRNHHRHMMPPCCARITSSKHKVSLTKHLCGSGSTWLPKPQERHFNLVKLFNIYLGKMTPCLTFIHLEEAFALWLIFCVEVDVWMAFSFRKWYIIKL